MWKDNRNPKPHPVIVTAIDFSENNELAITNNTHEV